MKSIRSIIIVLAIALASLNSVHAQDPLPSWNDGAAKQAIVNFVQTTTDSGSTNFVPPEERIATFDQDGTLWVEHPVYSQLMYCFDRVGALVKAKPELKDVEPFKTVISGDREAIAKLSMRDLEKIAVATLTGMDTEQFQAEAKKWLADAKDPRWKKPYTELTYQPMQEVLKYLRANGYKTYICTGGGQDFVRVYSQQVYGIPPEQVVGSSGKLKFEMRDGQPVLVKLPEINFIDDKDGKPIGIQQYIGRRPIAAFGNSDGDLQMLQYTGAGSGARFCLYVHHDDAEREYAYDRKDPLARLDKGLDEAAAKGWTVVSMKDDWKTIFPFEKN